MFQLTTRPLFEDHYVSVGVLAVVLLGLLLLGPARSRTTVGRRRALVLLRLAVIVLVVLAMLRPTVVYTATRKQSATVLLLFDRSRSMSVPDAFGNRTRWQALRDALDESLPALRELAEDLQVKVYAFDAEAEEIDWTEGLDLGELPPGRQTAIGSVLADVLRREAGQRMAAVILLSDGAQRSYAPRDVPPQVPARQLKDLGQPLHTVAFGQSGSEGHVRDVALKDFLVPPTVFVKNQLPVAGTAVLSGMVSRSVPVDLLWETSPGQMEVVGSAQLRARQDGEQLSLALDYAPQTPGEFRVVLRAEPQPGESVTTNNELTTYVTVLAGGLNVLYLEGRLLPEAKFLRRALAEAQNVQVDLVRIDAQRPETRPDDLAERFQRGKYDVYILGDLDSTALTAEEMAALRDVVHNGAGLIMLGGLFSFGPGGYFDTPLADVLPVVMDETERQRFVDPVRRDVHLQGPVAMRPTPLGQRHFVMLLDAPQKNAAAWRELPPLDGANVLVKKPAANVLAETPDGQPLLLADNAGQGRVMAFAGDSTWHWPMTGHGDAHRRFWRQVVLWLARKDQAAEGSVWVKLAERRFAPGSRVEFSAGARSPQGEAVEGARFTAELLLPDGRRQPVRVTPSEEQSTGTIIGMDSPGEYTVTVMATEGEQSLGSAQARFMVYEQDLELDNPAADPTVLANLAAMTGGEALSPEQLPELLERLKSFPLENEVQELTRTELYDNPLVLALLVLLLGLEWFLRKRWGLV